MKKPKLIILITVIVFFLSFVFIFYKPLGLFQSNPDSQLAMNTNQNDGSSLVTEVENTNSFVDEEFDLWKELIDENKQIKYKYPETLTAKYISTVTWPPIFSILPDGEVLVCEETPAESSFPQRVNLRRVDNDRYYCISASSEGAAGSVFTEFTYKNIWKEKVVELYFVLQYPRCDNYSDEQQSECVAERESFDLDALVNKIFLSLKEI